MLSKLKKKKKSNAILVIDKTFCSIDYNNLLIYIEVSEFQKIRDNLERLVRDYLDNRLSLLKIEY